MRQAQESEIIRLTMNIREYKEIKDFRGNEVQVVDARSINTGMLQWADQVLVGTNKTRIVLNNQMRKLLNYNTLSPQEGDKVICCRNYWGELSDQEYDLINGTIGFLHNKFDIQHYIPAYAGGGAIDVTMADFVTDNGDTFNSIAMDTHMIMTGEKCIDKKLAYRLMKNPKTSKIVPMEFTYGYAITVHRAQGSEWDKVLVLEESFPFNKKDHARWLYTACTRASEKLVLVR